VGNLDLPQAMQYFNLSVNVGDVSGIYTSGIVLENGYNVKSDVQGVSEIL
jgi:hypothetical protein